MEEKVVNERPKWIKTLALIVAIALCCFHIWSASVGILPGYALASIHWMMVGTYIILTKPIRFKFGWILDAVLLIINIYLTVYLIRLQEEMIFRSGLYTRPEIVLSVIAIISALAIGGRVLDKALPIMSVVAILYALFGHYLGGMFHTVEFSLSRIATYLYTSTDGLYGSTLLVSAQYIFLFLIFGSVLEVTGAGQFFVDLALSFTGRFVSGPAQASVYASMLMGTISGSGAANVAATGPFTIPLMRKVGYKADDSAAIASVAACGGQIMPPVMGAVAFMMSEMTGIEYGDIALAAMIPGILYYITLSMIVYFNARKYNLPKVPKEELKKPWDVFKHGWLHLSPIVVLAFLLFNGYSAQRAALYGIVVTLIVALLINRKALTIANFKRICTDSAAGIGSIAGSCLLAGIIIGVLNITGLGIKLSSILVAMSNGNLFIGLFLSMIASLVLGLGLPTSASYLILAVLVGPALIEMGASTLAAHLFLIYFAALSSISPPVALTVFTASGIANANNNRAGWLAMFYALGGILLPFMFVLNGGYLLEGSAASIIVTVACGIVGSCALAGGVIGWIGTNITIVGRVILILAGAMIMYAQLMPSLVGLACSAGIIFLHMVLNKKKAQATPAN